MAIKRIATLEGMKRKDANHAKRARRLVYIYSGEHHAYWRPKAQGYTSNLNEAGVWLFPEAFAITKHCGPEKRIEFLGPAITPPTTGQSCMKAHIQPTPEER